MARRFFVTGTDTGVGKTVVSAMLCATVDAIYWKPIQTGTREGSDRATVMRIAGIPRSRTAPEVYRFAPPVSPHLAARRANVQINLRAIGIATPAPGENLIAEGAGGVLVPVNDTQFMTDVMTRLGLPVLLVARTALGTINHTLLSIFALKAARLKVHGVAMVGKPNKENWRAIERYGDVEVLGNLKPLPKLNRAALMDAFRKHFSPRAFGV